MSGSVIRVRQGGVTATITGMDADTVRRMVERAMNGALRAIEKPMEDIAATARREWYGPNGVERETGQSGDIQVATTVDTDRGEVRVSVGSTDTSTVAMRKGAKHVDAYRVRFIHRPSSATLRAKAVTQEEWGAWIRRGAPALPPPSDKWWTDKDNGRGLARGKWYIRVTTHEGKGTVLPSSPTYRLLPDLVTKPATKVAKKLGPEIARQIAQAVSRG